MAAKTAIAMGRALRSSSSSYPVLPKRLYSSSSSSSVTRSPHLPGGFSRPVRSTVSLTHSLRVLAPGAVRLNTIRCLVNPSGAVYSLLRYLGLVSDPPPRYFSLACGRDYKHWRIVVDDPCGPGVTKQHIIDGYVETLAKVVGSKEEAQRRIYNISCDLYFGFGCEIDEETSKKLEGLPGVLYVFPDSYVDAENKDYGAELYVNGKIVKRSPEREKRVEMVPQSIREMRSY